MANNTQDNIKSTPSSREMSHEEFKNMLNSLAEQAEQARPEPPPKVQQLYNAQKKRRNKLAIVLLAVSLGLAGLVAYGIKYPGDMPMGLGGIFKAYVVGSKAPIPEPGQPLSPNERPRAPQQR